MEIRRTAHSASLLSAFDRPGPLWMNGDSTASGHNDRVPAPIAEQERYSLVLIQPELLKITVGTEGADRGMARRRVRGHFSLAGCDYVLAITDPIVEKPILSNPDGFSTELQNPFCVLASVKSSARTMPVTS